MPVGHQLTDVAGKGGVPGGVSRRLGAVLCLCKLMGKFIRSCMKPVFNTNGNERKAESEAQGIHRKDRWRTKNAQGCCTVAKRAPPHESALRRWRDIMIDAEAIRVKRCVVSNHLSI